MATITAQTNPQFFPAYYERKLLAYVKENLLVLKFGQKFTLPRNSGRQAVFTRFAPLQKATTPLTDNPTPSSGASMSAQQITVALQEYGNYIDLDEFTDMTSFVPLVDQAVDLLAFNAQQSLDTVGMQEITTGVNVLYAGGVADRIGLDGTKKITKSDIRKAVSILQRNNIPTFADGYYVCWIHPDKILDLFSDQELIQLSIAKPQAVEKGYIGEFGGVKFYVSTTLPIVNNNGIDIYQTVVFGQNAYGVVDLDGNTMQFVQTNLDKLGRVKTIGWKAYFAAKRLYEPAIVRIESN